MSAIVFRDLSTPVRLGWTAEERATPQSISIDLLLEFEQDPRACETDRLHDTTCYSELAGTILKVCGRKEFRLIERLGAEILDALREQIEKKHRLTIRVTKPHPPIAALRGGVSFIVGDNKEYAW